MKKSLLMCTLMASVLAACGGGGSTRTPPTVQTPNTYDVRNPTATGTQGIPVLAQAQVVPNQVAAQNMGGYVVVPPQPSVQPVHNPSQYNHAAVANVGTTAVNDGYVRASTENFSCDNGMNITIKHLEADTITIAEQNSKGNSILKRNGESFRATNTVLGGEVQWNQQDANATLIFKPKGRVQFTKTNCTLTR